MLSFAALRFRSIQAVDGGPIACLEEGLLDVFGRRLFLANARLREGLIPERPMVIFSDAHGSGVHPSQMVARHKAISEAIERWAHLKTAHSADRGAFAFDVDASSNGMAAFPGLFSRQARVFARFEAIERFCLLNWWERRIDGEICRTEWPEISAIAFNHFPKCCAVILFREADGQFAYGHAAAKTFREACFRALVELVRYEGVMRNWRESGEACLSSLFERRACFFSSKDGNRVFTERLNFRTNSLDPLPEVICDTEIIGPWTTYATVWRFLFRPPSGRFLANEIDYFFW